ncbi:MAG: hypothetical protein D6B25_14880 [Desulfobulbaceae bacterium]|nr:MAG: hypothetical protein D6B25_14880 [Desulfobulbaceae bacterium]
MKFSARALLINWVLLPFTAVQLQASGAQQMPMYTQPKPPVERPPAGIDKTSITSDFSAAYERAGKPKIAVFWNRKFDDQLSQWEATQRINMNQQITETRAQRQNRSGLGESGGFDFSAGYSQDFILNGVQLIDRPAVMRFVERKTAMETGRETVADYQKVEADALIGFADYFNEIVFVERQDSEIGFEFLVSVKEVSSGRVVAMFRSNPRFPEKPAPEPVWLVTDNGYQKVYPERMKATPGEVGERLALETMGALSKVW